MCPRNALRRVTVDSHVEPVMQEEQKQREEETFPFKLYKMLEYAGDSEFSACISWSADGSAFVIYDKDMLINKLAPIFFKQTKFRSFTRQLNMWGFDRTETPGGQGDSWRHNNFLRGRRVQLKHIERTKPMRKSALKAQAASMRTQASRSSNGDDSNHSLDSATIGLPAAAALQQPFAYSQTLSNVQNSASVQRFSYASTTQSGNTEDSSEMGSNRYVADTTSTSTSGAAQPFDELESSFIASIFERDEKSPEDDLASILSLDRESAVEDFNL